MLELTLERFIIQWLIWIQLIVLLLIFAFLFSFTIIISDPTNHETTASASTLQIQSLANHHSTPVAVTNPLHITRGVENLSIKGEIVTSANRGIVIKEIGEGEASSLYFFHPCYYFKLAKVAFLKCLGLDSMSESDNNPSSHGHMKKRKES